MYKSSLIQIANVIPASHQKGADHTRYSVTRVYLTVIDALHEARHQFCSAQSNSMHSQANDQRLEIGEKDRTVTEEHEENEVRITFKDRKGFSSATWSDSEFAADKEGRMSVTGGVITMDEAAVKWICTKQNGMSLSTMEAEFPSASNRTRDIGNEGAAPRDRNHGG
uniref:AlNc14C1345G12903 protein n=1 Tax=Albugo laibachii Nc14 TaxID=890382 RepID=F0X2N8_9STRA|nr:AlNc14C1345G12903 [Albugo laibachii Nc14]|eukprot:CCA28158.1 AlNc14C1345G12903 [Albugo laibachii Nc14]